MDYLALKIPADTSQPITSHIQKDQPSPEEGGCYPFKGDDGAYELCGCSRVEIVPAQYTDIRAMVRLQGDLYLDEEGLLNGKDQNWRATQMRYWYMHDIQDRLAKDWRDYCHVVGDACFVVPATDANVKMMEAILDS